MEPRQNIATNYYANMVNGIWNKILKFDDSFIYYKGGCLKLLYEGQKQVPIRLHNTCSTIY